MTKTWVYVGFIFWNRSIEMLFFTAYFLLLLFWLLQTHHRIEFVWGLRQKQYIYLKRDLGFFHQYRVIIAACLVFVLGSIPTNFALLTAWADGSYQRIDLIDQIFAGEISGLFLAAALGYLLTGIFVLIYVQRMPLPKTRKQATKVSSADKRLG
jgi:hypothetical protein